MSHLTRTMVEQFFEFEKESARGVLQKEMDLAMDTIFKQMKRKLMQLVDNVELGNETLNEQGDLCDPQQHERQLYSSLNDTNHIPSTTTNPHAHLNVLNASNISEHGDLGDRVHHEQLYLSSNQIPFTSTNYHAPDNTSNQLQDDEIIVKNELGEIVNIIPNEPITLSSTQPQSPNGQSNDSINDLFDEFDEDDCDCPECVGDLFVVKNEEGQEEGEDESDSDSVQFIEELDDSNARPTKRARVENENENDQAQVQAQPNEQSTHVITVSLKCSQCSSMFPTKHQLITHLDLVHSIGLYRCLYTECNQSLNKGQISHHYRTAHSNHFHCGNCSKQYQRVNGLMHHFALKHQSGLFRCAQANCDFTCEFMHLVLNHYKQSHKSVCKTIACNYSGCVKMFNDSYELKVHERSHRGAKPFRCCWPDCSYGGSAYRFDALKHIRTKHFDDPQCQVDPKIYLQVLSNLL